MKSSSILRLHLYVVLIYLLSSCDQKRSSSATVTDEIDSLVVLTETTDVEQTLPLDVFYEAVHKFSKDQPNYNPRLTQLIDTLTDFANHWLFEAIERKRRQFEKSESPYSKKNLAKLPDSSDYEMIDFIRQGVFYISYKKSNDAVFEEWTLKDSNSAERWLVLLTDSLRGNDYTKPPRFQWVEGSQLYMVSTRSAGQWFEFSDSLIMRLSGKTRDQIHNLYDPIDLKRFKEQRGLAHSTVISTEPLLFKESTGPHYSYFYFAKQRPLSGAKRRQGNLVHRNDFHITTSLHSPLIGDEKYESIKETLIRIKCAISDPALNSLDIVSKTIIEVEELFGPTRYQKEGLKVLGHSNRIIVVKMDQEKVSDFKYLRLSESFESFMDNEDMMNKILSFE